MLRLISSLARRGFSTQVADQLARLQAESPQIQEKIKSLQESKPYFDRLISFDPDYLAHIPYFLRPIEPFVEAVKDFMLAANTTVGMPWWFIIVSSCLAIRMTILPLILVQMRRISQLAPVSPVLVQLKNSFRVSKLPLRSKIWNSGLAAFQIIKGQNLKFYRLYLYNIFNIPLIVTMVYSIRRLLSEEAVASTSLLYIPSLASIDPYFILPVLTIALYYYNFQRFITKENANSIFSRIRSACQILLILWLPFLCYWPSGIVLYMFSNAVISVLQSTLLTRRWFTQKVTPKIVMYNYLLGLVEHDKSRSESIIESIRTGDQSYMQRAIGEEQLVEQTNNMIDTLNKQLDEPEQPAEEQPVPPPPARIDPQPPKP